VLVTEDAPAYGALAAVRALRKGGFEPWGAVGARDGYISRSRTVAGVLHAPDPVREPLAFARSLTEAAGHHGIRVVLPGTEAAQAALSQHHGLFAAAGVRLGTGSPDLLERTGSKTSLSALSEMAALSTPRTHTVDARSVHAAVEEIGFPIVIKPLRSRVRESDGTSRTLHVRQVDAASDLEAAVEEFGSHRFVAQPFITGQLYAVCGLSWNGRVVHTVHQVALRITPEPCGGSAFARTTRTDSVLDQKVKRLVGETGWSGIFQVQLLRAADGTDYVIDVNPRIYGTLALTVAAGANLPAMWTDLLLGRPARECTGVRRAARYRCEEKDMFAILKLFRRGRLLRALAATAPRPRTVHAVFSLRDPRPVLTSIGKFSRRRAVTAPAGHEIPETA
jgi:predicted ATP-grasp superfamily ATP-dependent carboligase